MTIPKAKPELIEKYKDLKDLRDKIYNWLILNCADKKVKNLQTKFYIGFNSTSIRKLVSGNAGETKLLCLTAIVDIVKQGELMHVDVDKKKRREILAVYFFKSSVQINDLNYHYWFTVRQLTNGNFIYSGNLDIKKPF